MAAAIPLEHFGMGCLPPFPEGTVDQRKLYLELSLGYMYIAWNDLK